jgi:hypothetical protein
MRLSEYERNPDLMRAGLYIDSAFEFAENFELDDFPLKDRPRLDYSTVGDFDPRPALYELERYIQRIRARHYDILEGGAQEEYVVLDEAWRSRATTYVQHIRKAVHSAEMEENLREPILKKLNELQAEIDRNRTRVAAVTETWLAVTEAMGRGAENLGPVARLLDKLSGPFRILRRQQSEDQPRGLPNPETLGLPDLSNASKEDVSG